MTKKLKTINDFPEVIKAIDELDNAEGKVREFETKLVSDIETKIQELRQEQETYTIDDMGGDFNVDTYLYRQDRLANIPEEIRNLETKKRQVYSDKANIRARMLKEIGVRVRPLVQQELQEERKGLLKELDVILDEFAKKSQEIDKLVQYEKDVADYLHDVKGFSWTTSTVGNSQEVLLREHGIYYNRGTNRIYVGGVKTREQIGLPIGETLPSTLNSIEPSRDRIATGENFKDAYK